MVILESITIDRDYDVRFVDVAGKLFSVLGTKSAAKKAIRKGELLINSQRATTANFLKKGDLVQFVDLEHNIPKAFPLEIEIVYEDDDLLVVNKPGGIVVSGNQHRTLEHALIDQCKLSSKSDALKWVRPAHRIDHATSGLVLFAKTRSAHRHLKKAFEDGRVQKQYVAIVHGKIDHELDVHDAIEGKPAHSTLRVEKSVPSLKSEFMSLLRLTLHTGRTHQLRIHCANSGLPIVGDVKYCPHSTITHKGLFLCSLFLSFEHPVTREQMEIEQDVPNKFLALLEREEKRFKNYFPKK